MGELGMLPLIAVIVAMALIVIVSDRTGNLIPGVIAFVIGIVAIGFRRKVVQTMTTPIQQRRTR